jgi:hypothetical protein
VLALNTTLQLAHERATDRYFIARVGVTQGTISDPISGAQRNVD